MTFKIAANACADVTPAYTKESSGIIYYWFIMPKQNYTDLPTND